MQKNTNNTNANYKKGALSIVIGIAILIGAITGLVYFAGTQITQTDIVVEEDAQLEEIQRLSVKILPKNESDIFGIVELLLVNEEKTLVTTNLLNNVNPYQIFLIDRACENLDSEDEKYDITSIGEWSGSSETIESIGILSNLDPTKNYSIAIMDASSLDILSCGDIKIGNITLITIHEDKGISPTRTQLPITRRGADKEDEEIIGSLFISEIDGVTFIDITISEKHRPEKASANIYNGTCKNGDEIIFQLSDLINGFSQTTISDSLLTVNENTKLSMRIETVGEQDDETSLFNCTEIEFQDEEKLNSETIEEKTQ